MSGPLPFAPSVSCTFLSEHFSLNASEWAASVHLAGPRPWMLRDTQVLQLCRLPCFSPVSISFQPKSYSTKLASLDEVPKEFFFSNSIEHDLKSLSEAGYPYKSKQGGGQAGPSHLSTEAHHVNAYLRHSSGRAGWGGELLAPFSTPWSVVTGRLPCGRKLFFRSCSPP